MKLLAHFQIHDYFLVKNQGIAIVGKLISGGDSVEITSGAYLVFPYDGGELTKVIKKIEVGFTRSWGYEYDNQQNLALLLSCETEEEMAELAEWKPDIVMAKIMQQDS